MPKLRGEITKGSTFYKKSLTFILFHTHFKKKIVVSFYICPLIVLGKGKNVKITIFSETKISHFWCNKVTYILEWTKKLKIPELSCPEVLALSTTRLDLNFPAMGST